MMYFSLRKSPKNIAYISDHLQVWSIDVVNMRFIEIDIDRRSSIDSHKCRRLLDRIISDRNDEIRLSNRLMDIVSCRE